MRVQRAEEGRCEASIEDANLDAATATRQRVPSLRQRNRLRVSIDGREAKTKADDRCLVASES
jgi:hypothetical protein